VPIIGIILVVGIAAAIFFFYGPAAVGTYPYYGWWWFPFPWFFIIPVIFLAFFAFRWIFWGGWGGRWYYQQYQDRALEILKERFARGEITKEQFEQIAKDLEGH
jgi:putative membrane protein